MAGSVCDGQRRRDGPGWPGSQKHHQAGGRLGREPAGPRAPILTNTVDGSWPYQTGETSTNGSIKGPGPGIADPVRDIGQSLSSAFFSFAKEETMNFRQPVEREAHRLSCCWFPGPARTRRHQGRDQLHDELQRSVPGPRDHVHHSLWIHAVRHESES